MHSPILALTHSHIGLHLDASMHAHRHMYALTCPHVHTHVCTHATHATHMHMSTHTHSHAHMYTHSHATRTHTHTCYTHMQPIHQSVRSLKGHPLLPLPLSPQVRVFACTHVQVCLLQLQVCQSLCVCMFVCMLNLYLCNVCTHSLTHLTYHTHSLLIHTHTHHTHTHIHTLFAPQSLVLARAVMAGLHKWAARTMEALPLVLVLWVAS